MSNYKIGDRVRVLERSNYSFVGAVGTVEEADEGGSSFFALRLDDIQHGADQLWWFRTDDSVEPVKTTTPPLYVFSDIPNDEGGKAFIADLRKYVNGDRYRLRVRGQYLKPGHDWRRYEYGQPIAKSKCLRVYVEEK